MGKPIAIGLDRLMRLPDLSADLRTTGGDRPFHAADERRVFVEPRRLFARLCLTEPFVGHDLSKWYPVR